MRTCRKCGASKPLDQFPIAISATGVRRHECHDCYKARHKDYYSADRKKYRNRSLETYYGKRREWLRTPEGVTWRRAQNKRQNQTNRLRVLETYGKECACCGESTLRFLTVDHVNGDGAAHRAVHRTGNSFYCWIIRNGFPADFQVLCFNCNIGRAMNGGICPHKDGSTTMAKASTAKRPEAPSPSRSRVKR